MLSLLEKEIAIESSQNYFNGTKGKLLFKVISNYLANTSDLGNQLKDLDDTIFYDKEKLEEYSRVIISYMADVTPKSKPTKIYTTGELSKFFGVSITTINNWIHEERLIGLEAKEKYKQSRISENTLWKSPNGELIPVKEVVKMYNQHNIADVSKKEEEEILMSEVRFFENKYNGTYEETLENKENITYEEQKDRSEWLYLIRRMEKQLL